MLLTGLPSALGMQGRPEPMLSKTHIKRFRVRLARRAEVEVCGDCHGFSLSRSLAAGIMSFGQAFIHARLMSGHPLIISALLEIDNSAKGSLAFVNVGFSG